MCDERSSTSTVDIADDGDVILVVGFEEKRLRVSSSSLANASKVFRSMFGPHFREGQGLGNLNSAIKEVPMPEDHADAMEIICNMMHFRSVSEEIGTDTVLHVAIAADKYDCRNVVQHAITLWVDQTKTEDLIELASLMASSYLLDNSKAFGQVTLRMILHHRGSYLPLAKEDVGLDLGVLLRICYLLEERRSLLRSELQQTLFVGAVGCGSDDEQCSCALSARKCLAYMELLQSEALQPQQMQSMALMPILDRMDRLRDPVLPQNNQRTSCSYRWHPDPNYRSYRSDTMNAMKARGGLGIDCVRRGAGTTVRDCRMKH